MTEKNDKKMVYPNHVAQAWEKKFRPQRHQNVYMALMVIGSLMAIFAIISSMVFNNLNETVAALIYALGVVGIVISSMAIFGLHLLALNFKVLHVALYGIPPPKSDPNL